MFKDKLCVIATCIITINYTTLTIILCVSDRATHFDVQVFLFPVYCFTFTADTHVATNLFNTWRNVEK